MLKTRPEDWWTTISQTIATRIDRVAENPVVRKFFVSHKGKKTLTVDIGPSVSGINDESFFQKMISKITHKSRENEKSLPSIKFTRIYPRYPRFRIPNFYLFALKEKDL